VYTLTVIVKLIDCNCKITWRVILIFTTISTYVESAFQVFNQSESTFHFAAVHDQWNASVLEQCAYRRRQKRCQSLAWLLDWRM